MDERRVFYVSYDGAQEPLGRSQIIPYLVRLAADYEITLISFEKSEDQSRTLATELSESGIDWIPLRYHRRPPVLSTALDVLRARAALRAAARRRGRPAIVHVRSYVPALMARGAANAKLLFDIRGFWADERVEGGLWRPGGVLYRVSKRYEHRFFSEADAIVTLTEASVPQIREWTGGRDVPIEVIPTCVDLERFGERPQRPGGPHAVWSGSIGTWYRFDLTERIARALGLPLTVLTLQTELARTILAGYPASVRAVAPERLPGELHSGDVGLCLIASSFSKTASAPTRFGEYLAAGMPVLVTRGIGDLERIVTDRVVGVVLEGEDEASIALAAERLRALAADEQVRARCRATARELFDVTVGAARYAQLYRRLIS
jgi:glycosyltransferase involved in cell wall biosynthesis